MGRPQGPRPAAARGGGDDRGRVAPAGPAAGPGGAPARRPLQRVLRGQRGARRPVRTRAHRRGPARRCRHGRGRLVRERPDRQRPHRHRRRPRVRQLDLSVVHPGRRRAGLLRRQPRPPVPPLDERLRRRRRRTAPGRPCRGPRPARPVRRAGGDRRRGRGAHGGHPLARSPGSGPVPPLPSRRGPITAGWSPRRGPACGCRPRRGELRRARSVRPDRSPRSASTPARCSPRCSASTIRPSTHWRTPGSSPSGDQREAVGDREHDLVDRDRRPPPGR